MSEEIKNEELNEKTIEPTIDEKLNELLNDGSIKTEDEKIFLKDIAESLKKGEMPFDLILNKTNEATSKLEDLKKLRPEFESFSNHYTQKINQIMSEMLQPFKDQLNKK